jgi:hypothetical protein
MKFLLIPFFAFALLLAVGSCTQVEYNRSVGNQYTRGGSQSKENIAEPQAVQLESLSIRLSIEKVIWRLYPWGEIELKFRN